MSHRKCNSIDTISRTGNHSLKVTFDRSVPRSPTEPIKSSKSRSPTLSSAKCFDPEKTKSQRTKSQKTRVEPKEPDISIFTRACYADDIDTIKSLFPYAFDHLPIRALPMISTWDIFSQFVRLPAKSKVYKFLKTEVIPDLNLDETEELSDIILEYREDWTTITNGYSLYETPDEEYNDVSHYNITDLIKVTSFGHWCSLDSNGMTFPEACFQIGKIKHFGQTYFLSNTVYEYFDALPFPTTKTVSILSASKFYCDTAKAMIPDYLTGQIDSTEKLIEDYITGRSFTEPDKENNILISIAANGKFHLFNSYFKTFDVCEDFEKQCTLPMFFNSDSVVDEFNKKYGHHYNYGLQDSKGDSLIFYNQRQSTIEHTSKKELKRYFEMIHLSKWD